MYLSVGFTKIRIGNIDACIVGKGDCASFVEAVDNNVKTKNWKQGKHVLSGGVISGTAIATLDNNGYISGGHSVIFCKLCLFQRENYWIFGMGSKLSWR